MRRRGPGEQPRPQEARAAPGSLLDCAGLRAGPQGAVRAPGLHEAHGPSHSLSKGGFVTVVDVYVLTLGSRGPLQPLGYEISALSPYWQPLPQEARPLTRCSVPVPHTGARPRGRHRGAASGGRGSCSWGPPGPPTNTADTAPGPGHKFWSGCSSGQRGLRKPRVRPPPFTGHCATSRPGGKAAAGGRFPPESPASLVQLCSPFPSPSRVWGLVRFRSRCSRLLSRQAW